MERFPEQVSPEDLELKDFLLTFQGSISFLVPCSLVDHLYLLSNEHLLTEDDVAIFEGENTWSFFPPVRGVGASIEISGRAPDPQLHGNSFILALQGYLFCET